MITDIWDKFWRDEEGRVVIWQRPNKWLIGWAAATFISLLFTGITADVLAWVGSAALIIWSLLEVFKGVNYFRRGLGLLVLVYSILTLIKSL